MKKIILGVTGSVAAIKTHLLAEKLQQFGEVKIVMTASAEYFVKAEYYYNKGEFEEANKWYSKAIEQKTDFAIAYCRRAYSKLNHFDNLLFEGAVPPQDEILPIHTEFYVDIITDFDNAIKYIPQYHDAYLGRGETKFRLYDWIGAIKDFTKAIEIEPRNAHAYYVRGHAKKNLRDDFDQRLTEFIDVNEANEAYSYYKDYQDDYNKAIELDSDYAEALKNDHYKLYSSDKKNNRV